MTAPDTGRGAGVADGPGSDDGPDTADLDLPPDLAGAPVDYAMDMDGGPLATRLLDNVPAWGPLRTGVGIFQLVPVCLDRDLALISTWMNDADVALFWMLAGSPRRTAEHVRRQLDGDGRSLPCLGVLDGLPMSYWELYRADLDPVAFHYPSLLHDTGVHLLIGSAEDRGRGLGAALLRGVTELVLRNRSSCRRLVGEPDVRNAASVATFEAAGFENTGEVDLPDKRAAIMIRTR
ncbi:GNAT family N-acetyltransferase [Streptomyces sp. SBT349]|uniref:GNAT family N-acetyltransferase n=1 Tax=Streptomyces sp. SBT349 TaxID=1580539 RepID=UPI00066D9518|nr:GNAT family N-acetyltransferase [Streptomyces sp. SBT349]